MINFDKIDKLWFKLINEGYKDEDVVYAIEECLDNNDYISEADLESDVRSLLSVLLKGEVCTWKNMFVL